MQDFFYKSFMGEETAYLLDLIYTLVNWAILSPNSVLIKWKETARKFCFHITASQQSSVWEPLWSPANLSDLLQYFRFFAVGNVF